MHASVNVSRSMHAYATWQLDVDTKPPPSTMDRVIYRFESVGFETVVFEHQLLHFGREALESVGFGQFLER